MGALPNKLILRTLLLVAVALPLAGAQECVPSSTTPVVAVVVPGVAGYYLAEDCLIETDRCDFHGSTQQGIWVYEETNWIEGLQRADEVHDDTCGGRIPGDTFVF